MSLEAECIRNEKVKLLQSIRTLKPVEVAMIVVRGQYFAGVVDGQPDGDGLRRRERPVAGVLVPGHRLAVARHLAEEVRPPADYVLSEQVAHPRDDARVRQQVPDASVVVVAVAAPLMVTVTPAATAPDTASEMLKV